MAGGNEEFFESIGAKSGVISQKILAADANTRETLRVETTCNYEMTGGWTNVIYAKLDYETDGDQQGGIGAAICADMMLPNSTTGGGSYYAAHLSINPKASTDVGSHTLAYLRLEAWGTAGHMDSNGELFHLVGVTAGNGNLFSNGSPSAFTHALRIKVDSTDYFIPLAATYNAS